MSRGRSLRTDEMKTARSAEMTIPGTLRWTLSVVPGSNCGRHHEFHAFPLLENLIFLLFLLAMKWKTEVFSIRRTTETRERS